MRNVNYQTGKCYFIQRKHKQYKYRINWNKSNVIKCIFPFFSLLRFQARILFLLQLWFILSNRSEWFLCRLWFIFCLDTYATTMTRKFWANINLSTEIKRTKQMSLFSSRKTEKPKHISKMKGKHFWNLNELDETSRIGLIGTLKNS